MFESTACKKIKNVQKQERKQIVKKPKIFLCKVLF